MAKNLVIVESPAKAKTIEKFLGKNLKLHQALGTSQTSHQKSWG